jgi:hypothetical protein
MSLIYLIEADGLGAIKVGRAMRPRARLNELQVGCPVKLRLVAHGWHGSNEPLLHDWLVESRIRGEWYEKSEKLDIVENLLKQGRAGWLAFTDLICDDAPDVVARFRVSRLGWDRSKAYEGLVRRESSSSVAT